MTSQVDDIPFVDVTVRSESLQDDLFKIIQARFPTVRREQVTFEECQGGCINSVVKCTGIEVSPGVKKSIVLRTYDMKFSPAEFMKLYVRNGLDIKKADTPNSSNGHEAVNGDVGKVNGRNEAGKEKAPSGTFKRVPEYLIMHEISKYGLCQPIFARYQNGCCYGYAEGATLTGPLMLSEDYLQEAASKFARFHSIKYEIPNLNFKALYDRTSCELMEIYYENLLKIGEQIASIKEGPYLEMPKLKVLIDHEKRITRALKQIGLGKIVFCHNDPNQKNLIWNPQAAPGSRLLFIDLEMTGPNYQIFDLAYNFGCFGGHLLVDFDDTYFPNSDYRRRFLRKYLQEYHKAEQIELSEEEFNSELENLFHRVSLAAIGHLLKWCIYGPVFDKSGLLKNAELTAACEKDKHFIARYALRLYQTFVKFYPQVLEDALEHFEKKPTSRSE